MAKRKKKGASYTPPKNKNQVEKRTYTQEEVQAIKESLTKLKFAMSQTYIFGLLSADLSKTASNALIESQKLLREQMGLLDPKFFYYFKHAIDHLEKAKDYLYASTNRLSYEIIDSSGERALEYVQDSSDMFQMFLGIFSILIEQTYYDVNRLEIVWNTLVDLIKQFGLTFDEEEPDWTNFKNICEAINEEEYKK